MKTAEEIIQEYRDRGYSLESLRILAESREEPLGGEMLAVLDALEAREPSASAEESAMAEVACETGTYGRVGDDMVFFVADDEGAADGESGEAVVDFDVMAETVEEVLDDTVCVDYLPGSVVLPLEAEAEAPEEVMELPAAPVKRRRERRRERKEKRNAHAVNILTCEDVVTSVDEGLDALVAPETLAVLSAHAFTLVNSLVALSQEELAKAAAIIEEDRAALQMQMIEQNNEEAVLENNVILFSDSFSAFDEEFAEEDEAAPLSLVSEEEEDEFESVLRVLPAPESEIALVNSCDVAEEAVEQLLAEESLPVEEVAEEEPVEEPVTEEIAEESAGTPLAELLERETALRLELESEYQARLDVFAGRILEAQTAVAANETKLTEKTAELEARAAVLAEMQARLAAEEEKQRELLQKLEEASSTLQSKDGELGRFESLHTELKDEHAKLYSEFEDLRRAYNEVVTDVMPQLQTERDELAVTVERQCEKEKTLKTSLTASRKRLAAGYILGAAACLMLVTLPVANWLRSGDDNRRLAVDHQQFSELRETLSTQMQQNVQAQTRIVELERKMTRARDEITRLDGRNKELASLSAAQHSQGIAVFKPEAASASGSPTRAVTMALQATTAADGKLHVNEVMDPAGSIEQLAMANRAEGARTEMAAARGKNAAGALQVSAVARTDGSARSLRPTAQAAARPATETVKGIVKKGEGVAQVVYRVLNTRDPDVIAWVIEENNIKSDRRGNPIIQPNQELRLPAAGRTGQSASATRRRR